MTEIIPVAIAPPPARIFRRRNDENPYHVYLDSLKSRDSQQTMRGCLARAAKILGWPGPPEELPWENLRFQHVQRLRVLFGQQTRDDHGETVPWSPSSVNKHMSAVRGVLRTAWQLGLMTTDDHERARKVEGDTGTRLPPGRSIAEAEMVGILNVCSDGSLIGLRNTAIVAVLYATGARRAEIAGARCEHYNPGGRNLRIIGKRDKEREVYLSENAAAHLGSWLSRINAARGPLFRPVNRWGQVVNRHMSPRAVSDVIEGARHAAGLPKLSPHDFRRTFIGNLLDEGVDLVTVQELVGHQSPTTTGRYDRRPAATRKAAAERIRIPHPDDLKAATVGSPSPTV